MKKLIIFTAILICSVASVWAQKTMVVNTETIFKSMATYNDALATLEKLSQQYQNTVDQAYAEIERMYNEYQQLRPNLSEVQRMAREDAIITREKEIEEYQVRVFGQEGDLIKRRVELIKPVQDKVFTALNDYARRNGYEIVMDVAANPSLLYYDPSTDKTDEIIRLVK